MSCLCMCSLQEMLFSCRFYGKNRNDEIEAFPYKFSQSQYVQTAHALMLVWVRDNRDAGDLRRHRGHYDVNVMLTLDVVG